MIGLLIIAHAPLADAMLICARHIYGSVPLNCVTLDIPSKAEPADYLEQAKALHASVDTGAGVLVLTDMFGATPTNIATRLSRPGRTAVLTGINLPMLLRALTYRESVPLEILVEKASSGATAGVIRASANALQNQRNPPTSSDNSNDDANTRLHNQQ